MGRVSMCPAELRPRGWGSARTPAGCLSIFGQSARCTTYLRPEHYGSGSEKQVLTSPATEVGQLLGIVLFCLGFPDQALGRSSAAIAEARKLASSDVFGCGLSAASLHDFTHRPDRAGSHQGRAVGAPP